MVLRRGLAEKNGDRIDVAVFWRKVARKRAEADRKVGPSGKLGERHQLEGDAPSAGTTRNGYDR